jgi:hypothetical protein
MTHPATTREDLLAAAARLTDENPAFPAGSVIRCFARQVARARRQGTAAGQLASVAEAGTRTTLARRGGPGVPAGSAR